MWSTLSLPLLLGQHWPNVIVTVRVTSTGQIAVCKLFVLDKNTLYIIVNKKKKQLTTVYKKCKLSMYAIS